MDWHTGCAGWTGTLGVWGSSGCVGLSGDTGCAGLNGAIRQVSLNVDTNMWIGDTRHVRGTVTGLNVCCGLPCISQENSSSIAFLSLRVPQYLTRTLSVCRDEHQCSCLPAGTPPSHRHSDILLALPLLRVVLPITTSTGRSLGMTIHPQCPHLGYKCQKSLELHVGKRLT